MVKGMKHDHGKVNLYLLPERPLEEVAKVLMCGAVKYAPWNWVDVVSEKGGRERIMAAMRRHYNDYKEKEEFDKETGLSHMAHLACNALFLIWLDLPEEDKQNLRRRLDDFSNI